AAKAGAILKERFNVIPIKLSKEGKAALAEAPSALFGGRAEYICKVLRRETHGQSFNYFLHVTNMKSPWGLRKKAIVGLGIVHGFVHRLGFHQDVYVHAVIHLGARDGATCEIRHSDAPEGNEGILSRPFYGPHRAVDRSWFPAPSSAAQNTR